MSLKDEIESRPSQDDYDEKIKQCNVLRTELTSLTEQMSYNEKLLEEVRTELDQERSRQRHRNSDMSECSSQTDPDEDDEDVSVIEVDKSTKKEMLDTLSSELEDQIDNYTPSSSTEMPQNHSISATIDDDDELNNHPKVLYEDELIVFKEKCKTLCEENVRLQRELSELRTIFGNFNGNWVHNVALKYLVPLVIVFIAYIFFFVR